MQAAKSFILDMGMFGTSAVALLSQMQTLLGVLVQVVLLLLALYRLMTYHKAVQAGGAVVQDQKEEAVTRSIHQDLKDEL